MSTKDKRCWTCRSQRTPDPIQYAALAVVDGRPTAVVAVCGRSTVDVDVYQNDGRLADGGVDSSGLDNDLHIWSVTVTLSNPAEYVEVELLGPDRPGWEVTSRAETVGTGLSSYDVVPLTSIDPGHRYTLDSSAAGPEGASAPSVTFSTDDLTRIGAGQVLAAIDYEHSKVVSRDWFVKERCG